MEWLVEPVICNGCFNAVIAGIVSGNLVSYLSISCGSALLSTSVDMIWFMNLMGTDIHCFLSSDTRGKYAFFVHQMINVTVALFCSCVNLVNRRTTAFRY